jgi:aspartate-semialdehyde dehydrogenase
VSFGDNTVKVQDLAKFNFKGIDIVLASAGGKISAEYAPKAAKSGAVVIDNSSFFRMDKDVPLVVPEVNPEAIKGYSKKGIIANPNCSTIQMVVALKPLHDLATIKRVVVATYQSVSGAGKEAMDELFEQTRALYSNAQPRREVFAKQISFNVIPQIDVFMDDGYTKEEWKMRVETKKILGPDIEVTATCVRVPVFLGHSEAINVEFKKPITPAAARKALQKAKGVTVIDKPDEDDPGAAYITPVEIAGEDPVYVSRIRKDDTVKYGLSLWVVADNLRKGAATNAVQIAEVLAKKYL